MRRKSPSRPGEAREDRVRALGFDPAQLTPEEQVELLEMSSALAEPWPKAASVARPRWKEAPLP